MNIHNEFKIDYQNRFLGVPEMLVTPKFKAIVESKFSRLLTLVKPENGIQMKILCSRKYMNKTNHYKPWLKQAFLLGLYNGGRSEDIVELKWSDILLQEDGKFDIIETIDHKINNTNSNRISAEDQFIKHFAITKSLVELLIDMSYLKYKVAETLLKK